MRTRLLLWAALGCSVLLGLVLSVTLPAEAARNSAGTYSLPTGPVVSGTTIRADWANSTLSDLANEVTSSLDRNGRGAMLAPLPLSSGTVSAPGLTFGADPNTGLYRAAENDVRMSAGGTAVQTWTPTDTTIASAATIGAGGAALKLKPGTADRVFAEFYADTEAPTTRSGYVGFPVAGGSNLRISNEVSNGDVEIQTTGTGRLSVPALVIGGGTPISSSFSATFSIEFGALAAGVCANSAPQTLTGVATGGQCLVGMTSLPGSRTMACHVNAANQVTLTVCAISSVSSGAQNFVVRVFQ